MMGNLEVRLQQHFTQMSGGPPPLGTEALLMDCEVHCACDPGGGVSCDHVKLDEVGQA